MTNHLLRDTLWYAYIRNYRITRVPRLLDGYQRVSGDSTEFLFPLLILFNFVRSTFHSRLNIASSATGSIMSLRKY